MDRKEIIHYNGGKKRERGEQREKTAGHTDKRGRAAKEKGGSRTRRNAGVCIPLEKDELIQLKICLTRR